MLTNFHVPLCECDYLDRHSLHLLKKHTKQQNICTLHLNIRGLHTKKDSLQELNTDLRDQGITIHFILLCETNLNSVKMKTCNIDGYSLICNNREGERGGVAMYVLDSISYTLRHDLAIFVSYEFESIFIQTTIGKKKYIIGEVYRVPNTSELESIERYSDIIDLTATENCEVIIGTDQNFDLLRTDENRNCSTLLNTFTSNGLAPSITKPTRSITHSSAMHTH